MDLYKADHTQHMYVLIQSYFDRMDWSTLCNHFQKYKIIFSIILLQQLNKSIHEKKTQYLSCAIILIFYDLSNNQAQRPITTKSSRVEINGISGWRSSLTTLTIVENPVTFTSTLRQFDRYQDQLGSLSQIIGVPQWPARR